jgi:hypothetical protein
MLLYLGEYGTDFELQEHRFAALTDKSNLETKGRKPNGLLTNLSILRDVAQTLS